jgi:hypothetical protein
MNTDSMVFYMTSMVKITPAFKPINETNNKKIFNPRTIREFILYGLENG